MASKTAKSATACQADSAADAPRKTWRGLFRLWRHRLNLAYHWGLRPHAAYQPLFVLATPRTGSTLLTDYLRRLRGVTCRGEVLNLALPIGLRRDELSSAKAIRHIRRSFQAMRQPIRGCKLLLLQMQECGLTVDELDAAFPDAMYLILYRESMAEQFISFQCARATGEWVLRRDQDRRQVRVEIDPEELEAFCDATRRDYEVLLANDWLRERSILLSYEELIADHGTCFVERVCPFLGVPASEPATRMLKQNVLPMADRVVNFAEVAETIAGPWCRQRHAWPAGVRPARQAA